MKKIIVIAASLTVIVVIVCSFYYYFNRCIINNYVWGMSEKMVISLKNEDSPGANVNTLCYSEDFFGKKCNVTYVFGSEDKLSSINVNVRGIFTYNELIDLMKQKYGEPFKEDVVTNSFMGVTESAKYAVWKKGNTYVRVVGQNTINWLTVDYTFTKKEEK